MAEPKEKPTTPEQNPTPAPTTAEPGQPDNTAQQLAALQQENEALKAQMLQSRISAEAMTQAGTLGVTAETVPYLLKLADLSGAVDDKGNISRDSITEALNQVLTDVPALKAQSTQAKGFTPIGGTGMDTQSAEAENRMRSWFGLTAKK